MGYGFGTIQGISEIRLDKTWRIAPYRSPIYFERPRVYDNGIYISSEGAFKKTYYEGGNEQQNGEPNYPGIIWARISFQIMSFSPAWGVDEEMYLGLYSGSMFGDIAADRLEERLIRPSTFYAIRTMPNPATGHEVTVDEFFGSYTRNWFVLDFYIVGPSLRFFWFEMRVKKSTSLKYISKRSLAVLDLSQGIT